MSCMCSIADKKKIAGFGFKIKIFSRAVVYSDGSHKPRAPSRGCR